MSTSGSNRVVEIVQYGLGGVGRALLGMVVEHGAAIRAGLGIDLRYRALTDSTSVMHISDSDALSQPHLRHVLAGLANGRLADQPGVVAKPDDLAVLATELNRLKSSNTNYRLIVVDVSGAAAQVMEPVLTAALRQGQRAVLANKRPLCGPIGDYRQMMAAAGPSAMRLRYETTVGAALPVVSTVRSLLDAQDSIGQISGTFSGTLGYLTSRLEEGAAYSQAVREAKERGYTEPDPRDDLGGVDVARKALILSRLLGSSLELAQVEIEPLYPANMAELNVTDFMAGLESLDQEFADRVQGASSKGAVLRYVATVGEGRCRVGLEQVDRNTPLGRLSGTNNMIVFQTKRYKSSPLVVQGPGAGADLTASGVLADIISLAR